MAINVRRLKCQCDTGNVGVAQATAIRHYRGAPRIFSRGGPEQKLYYIVASRVRNINLTYIHRSTNILQACSDPPHSKKLSHTCYEDANDVI